MEQKLQGEYGSYIYNVSEKEQNILNKWKVTQYARNVILTFIRRRPDVMDVVKTLG